MLKISVIVPVYNVEPYLRKCLDSLLSQTYKDFEIVLIDDGSPDKSGDICDEYAQKYENISVIHQKNAGPSTARNAGIEQATGEYITFVDSDDWVTETFLEDMMRSSADLLCQEAERLDEDGNIIDQYHFCNKFYPQVNQEIIIELYQNSALHCSAFKRYKRAIIAENHLKLRTDLSNNEDILFNVQYCFCINSIEVQEIANYKYVIYKSRKTLSQTQSLERFSEMRKGVGLVCETLACGDREKAKDIYCQKQIATYSGFYHDIYDGSLGFFEGLRYLQYLMDDEFFVQMLQRYPGSCVPQAAEKAIIMQSNVRLLLPI